MGTRGGEGRPRRARRAAHHHRQTSPARFGALPRSGAGRPLPPLPPPNLNSPPALPPHRDMTHAAREALVTDFGLIGLESRGSGGDLARAAAASNAAAAPPSSRSLTHSEERVPGRSITTNSNP